MGVTGDFPPLRPEPTRLTRDERGIWSTTLGPLSPNIWTYNFVIDGVELPWALFEVPADTPQFYNWRPIPHGTIHRVAYESKSLGIQRTAFVYTPPGYETTARRYPVLYLLHPAGRTGTAYWQVVGQAHVIVDNLIADRKGEPLIVVMPFGYPQVADRESFGQASEYRQDHSAFGRDLVTDLIPFVERTYRVLADPDHRAIAGASMGGLQAMILGSSNLDRFHWIGAFSGLGGLGPTPEFDTRFAGLLKDPVATNRRVRLLWFTAGDQEKAVSARNHALSQLLEASGIRHTFVTMPGWSHQPGLWRQNLHDFIQLLFRP